MLKKILLLGELFLTLALIWFAVSNFRSALPLAEENLRGVALSLSAAVENIASHDSTLQSLMSLRTKDLAFLAVLDKNGVYRFHSNPDLINSRTEDLRHHEVLQKDKTIESRVVLGTGEKAYEFLSPIHLANGKMVLHLTLHTYRADAVIRKAGLNLIILFSLLLTSWIMSAVIYRFAIREEKHQEKMIRQENLTRLGEMGATLAHEIRNPLGGIKGFAQIIEKKPQDPRNSHFAQMIVTEVLRLENLVTSLLAYARNDNTSIPVLFDLKELIDHAVSLMRDEMEQHDVTLSCNSADDIQLCGHRDRIEQVLLNLIKNAIQAMPDGGTLTIDATATGKKISINVSDTGQGIKGEDKDKIFAPFFTTRATGTGLGLALCKKIVSEHNGSIGITSNPGTGTTVTVELPRKVRR